MRKPELLIPASSLEVLKTAVRFGADAVKPSVFVPRLKTFLKKKWQRALPLPISMV